MAISGYVNNRAGVSGGVNGAGGVSGDMSVGMGGTSDYNELENKPSINSVEVSGDKTAHDYGIANLTDIPSVPVYNLIKTNLYTAPDINDAPFTTNIQLNDNINNYDIIGILISNPTDITNANIYCTQFVMPVMINDGKLLSFQPYGTRVLNYTIQNDTLYQNVSTGDHPYYNRIYQIWGVKMGAIV